MKEEKNVVEINGGVERAGVPFILPFPFPKKQNNPI